MTPKSAAILIVEDEPQIRRFVRSALESEGFHVHEATTIAQGLIEAGTRKPDLIVLDLGLPDGNGVDFIREVRGWSNLPIIVLSARTDEQEKIAALDQGADDYLTKPFGVGELLARIRAALRRQTSSHDGESAVLEFGGVHIEFANRTVLKDGNPVHLTPIEYRLLSHLAAFPNKVLTHRQILREVWGPSHTESPHYLRIYMANLRQKLENDPAQPRHFITETGVGYRFLV